MRGVPRTGFPQTRARIQLAGRCFDAGPVAAARPTGAQPPGPQPGCPGASTLPARRGLCPCPGRSRPGPGGFGVRPQMLRCSHKPRRPPFFRRLSTPGRPLRPRGAARAPPSPGRQALRKTRNQDYAGLPHGTRVPRAARPWSGATQADRLRFLTVVPRD